LVNHVRTLLANLPPLAGIEDGDEYIPSAFVPVPENSMSVELRRVRRTLFGTNPSRDSVNVRVAALLAIVHAGPLSAYLTATDPRITYEPDGSAVYGSAIAEADKLFDLPATLAALGFLGANQSRFFTNSVYRDAWSDPEDLFRQTAAIVLMTAQHMETAGATAQ